MKKMSKIYSIILCLLSLALACHAQIPTTPITGPTTYTSISPVDASAVAIPGIGVEDMVTFNVREILKRDKNGDLVPVNGTGIDASFTDSLPNPSINSPLATAPDPNSYSSIVIVKVYSFDRTKPGGKGPMIWGIYSTQSTTEYNFLQAGWKAEKKVKGDEKDFISNQIIKGVVQDDSYFFKNTPNCEPPPKTKASWVAPAGVGYSFDCYYKRGKDRIQPVIVEVTIKNATLRSIKFPRYTVINAQYFPLQIPTSNVTVVAHGSNYEVNTISEGLNFGHAISPTNGANRFKISNVNGAYRGAKFTGVYGSIKSYTADPDTKKVTSFVGSTDSYLKCDVFANQDMLIAYETGTPLTAALLGSTGFTPTKVLDNAFTITDAISSTAKTFTTWRVAGTSAAKKWKFAIGLSGPFIIANAFDVNFKENTSIPIAKRKLFNRYQFLDDVLVCAHRGLWNQTGQPGNGSTIPRLLNGIAENTIDAYEAALANTDVDWIEFDARRTSDGVFVAWHDDYVWRITDKFDPRECIPINEVNQRDRLYADTQPGWKTKISQYAWADMQNLQLRDYLGCKVKSNNGAGTYINPLKLIDGFQWVKDKAASNKYTSLSIDFKDGLYYLNELYQMVLTKDLEGQVLFSVYAKDFSLAQYQAEYGVTFLRQIPLKPTFYEPTETGDTQQYGGDLPQRLAEYVKAADNGHTVSAITINVNNDSEPTLTNLIRQTNPPAYPADKMWYVSHYLEPYMVSIYDNLRISATADCDPTQHPGVQNCVNLFWRADFDWLLNNGTNGIFSDNPEPLISYLKAKGKK